jgi:hypothetical protein
MQEDIITLPPDYKLYNSRAVWIGTFLGGPLVAGYFAAENFKLLGQRSSARIAWIIAIIGTLLTFAAVSLVPAIASLPKYILPLAYTSLAQFLIQKFQGASLKKHIAEGGQLYSAWRAALIGLIGLVVLFAIFYAILFVALQDTVA